MARDRYLEKFLDSKFADVMAELTELKQQAKERDTKVEQMDTRNNQRLSNLESQVEKVVTVWKVTCWVGGILGTLATGAAAVWGAMRG